MNTHADKVQDNKSQSVANGISQKRNGIGSTFQFADNRPETIAQRKLYEMSNNSRQAASSIQLYQFADKSSENVMHMQDQVEPTLQMKGKVNVNDDAGLEKEADLMGEKALQKKENTSKITNVISENHESMNTISLKQKESKTVQRAPVDFRIHEGVDHAAVLPDGLRFQFDTSRGTEARTYLDVWIINHRVREKGLFLISQAIKSSPAANNTEIADRLRLSDWFDHKYNIKSSDHARGFLEPELGPDL